MEGLKGAASENEDDEKDILDRPDRKLQILSDTAFSSLDDESTIKSSTSTPALFHRSYIAKSHLLRARSFWSPTWCSVCSKNILTGWMQGKNYECEVSNHDYLKICANLVQRSSHFLLKQVNKNLRRFLISSEKMEICCEENVKVTVRSECQSSIMSRSLASAHDDR